MRFYRPLPSNSLSIVVFQHTSKPTPTFNLTVSIPRIVILRWKQKAIIFALMVPFLVIVDCVFFQSPQ